jgi:hypothetical protein
LLVLLLGACGDEAGVGGSSLTGKTYLSTAVTEGREPKQLTGGCWPMPAATR